jgi:hypothetical protein
MYDEAREEPEIGEIIEYSLFFLELVSKDENYYYGKPVLLITKPFINGVKPTKEEYMIKRPLVRYTTLQEHCDSKISTLENFIQTISKLSNACYNYQNNIDKDELTKFRGICD